MPSNFDFKTFVALLFVGLFVFIAGPVGAQSTTANVATTTDLSAGARSLGHACAPASATLSCGVGISIGCSACAADAATDRLESFSITLSQAGVLRRDQDGLASHSQEFSVPVGAADSSNPNAVLAASIAVSYELLGILAAAGDSSADVTFEMIVADVTGLTGDAPGRIIAGKNLYSNGVAGSVTPGASVGAGVLLPSPNGEAEVSVGIEIGIDGEVVDASGTETLALLLQRGHTYKLTVTLASNARVGALGGASMARFTALPDAFADVSRLIDPELWVNGIADRIVALPNLDPSTASFDIPIPFEAQTTFPGFNSVTILAETEIAGVTIGPIATPSIPLHRISPTLSFNPLGDLNTVGAVLSAAGIPDLTSGRMQFDDLIGPDFIDFIDFDLAPDEAVTMGGATITGLSVTIQDDTMAEITANIIDSSSTINNNIDSSVETVNQNIINSTETVNSNISNSTSSINTNIDNSTTTIVEGTNEGTETLLKFVELLSEDALRRDIQTNLGHRHCEPWMYTPENFGNDVKLLDANLEVVFDVIQTVISNAWALDSMSPRRLDRAQNELDHAMSRSPQDAHHLCKSLIKAYHEATDGHESGHSH